jgi:hypothetical protein
VHTTHQQLHLPHKLRKELQQDPHAYVESVGKADIATLADVMTAPAGKGTVLRLVMGATVQMPLRALTYVDSALHCAAVIPNEQLQIVHASRLGQKNNGVDRRAAQEGIAALATAVRNHVGRAFPQLEGSVLHAEDTELDLSPFTPIAKQAFAQNPDVARRLLQKGSKHGGDATRYASAHFAFQDTDILELEALGVGVEQTRAERIVSIGCQQERNFYLARMAMRDIAVETDIKPLMVDSAQVFTRHLTPPYFTALGGEPSITETSFGALDPDTVGDTAARRDIAHFLATNHIGTTNHA